MADRRSPLTITLTTIAALAAAATAAWFGAGAAANFIEDRSQQDVRMALQMAGYDWALVDTDGLQVRLTGTAPDEVQRFRAMTQAATVVDSKRILDEMDVATRETLNPPDFEIELLRNDEGISLIGLVPAGTDRTAIIGNLERQTTAPEITDLLEAADYPVPTGWDAALNFGLRAAQAARRAKISIAPGQVSVTAITDNVAEKGRLETELTRAQPQGVRLSLDISAPRPVIAPFTLRFVIDETGPHFDACAADTEDTRKKIVDAAIGAGVMGKPGCTVALGAPSPRWGEGAVAAIETLTAMGAGTVTLSDADIALIAPASVKQARFDELVGRLEKQLPPVFSLQATREQPVDTSAGPAEFSATLSPDGAASLRGRITDDRMRDAVESFARARFSAVDSSLRSDDTVPGGWTVRVIAALEAMAPLQSGSVSVTPEILRITGTSGDQQASDKAAAVLARRLGAGASYQLSLRYDRRLDPALGLPDGDECVARLNTVMSESAIGFEPNKSKIAGDPEPTLTLLAKAMQDCAEFRIEAGGHTDSQGSEGFNADLSRARAQALVKAMTDAGIDTGNISARGYGESQPIATNDTDEGREANRRIEFQLLSPVPLRDEALPDPVTVSGVTGAAQPAAAAEPDMEVPADAGGTVTLPDPALSLPGTAPATLGVQESLGLDGGEENVNVPVMTPDAETPRPAPRPGN